MITEGRQYTGSGHRPRPLLCRLGGAWRAWGLRLEVLDFLFAEIMAMIVFFCLHPAPLLFLLCVNPAYDLVKS